MRNSQARDRPALNIILVEDDDGDAKALARAFEQAQISYPITRFADGVEALAFLRGEMNQVPPPHFVVLSDINMPRKNGIELLREIRSGPALRDLLFIVLTTSDDKRDISEAYAGHVAGYILKSKAGPRFADLMATFGNYWQSVEIPEILIRKAGDGYAQHSSH